MPFQSSFPFPSSSRSISLTPTHPHEFTPDSRVPVTPNIERHNPSNDQQVPGTPVTQPVVVYVSSFERSPAIAVVANATFLPLPEPDIPQSVTGSVDQCVPSTPQGLVVRSRREEADSLSSPPSLSQHSSHSCNSMETDRTLDLSTTAGVALSASRSRDCTSTRHAGQTSRRRLSLSRPRESLQRIAQHNVAQSMDPVISLPDQNINRADDCTSLSVNTVTESSVQPQSRQTQMLPATDELSLEREIPQPLNHATFPPERITGSDVTQSVCSNVTQEPPDSSPPRRRDELTRIRRQTGVMRSVQISPETNQGPSLEDSEELKLFDGDKIFG